MSSLEDQPPPVSVDVSDPAFIGGTDDRSTSDSAISAFMAVPQYTTVFDFRDGSYAFRSEAVNAVMERDDFALHEVGPQPSSPPTEWYISDSEMTDALSEMGGVPLGPYIGEHVGTAHLHQSLDTPISAHPTSFTISSDTEDDGATDLIMEYEPSVMDNRSTSRSVAGDDPDDTQKFYSDDGDDYEDDRASDMRTRHGTADLSEVDVDEFYQGLDPAPGSQLSDLGTGAMRDDYSNVFSEGEDSSTADPAGEPHFTDPVVGTSKTPLLSFLMLR